MKTSEKKGIKTRIIDAAWKLFREKGYEATTLDNILEEAQIAKGSFYYYFKGKGDLLATLSDLLDDRYEELEKQMPDEMDSFEKLMFLDYEAHKMIERTVPVDLMASMYAEQLQGKGYQHLLDQNRIYYRLLNRIIEEGQRAGTLASNQTASQMVKVYVLAERAIVTDWCLNKGSYSLAEYSSQLLPELLSFFRA